MAGGLRTLCASEDVLLKASCRNRGSDRSKFSLAKGVISPEAQ
jgi:hypothetical protein